MFFSYYSEPFCAEKTSETSLEYELVDQDDIQPGDEMKVFDLWHKIPDDAISTLRSTKNSCMYSRIYFRRPKET